MPKLTALPSALKRAELSVFTLFKALSQEQAKFLPSLLAYSLVFPARPIFFQQFGIILQNLEFSSIFQFFPLGIWLGAFFYQ